jgi:glycosyltransferase involved in cell wall biosynthesis
MPVIPEIDPAILFEPDGYSMNGQKVMGRQSAGNGFLRAAVHGARGRPLYGYTPRQASAQAWVKTVQEISPKAKAEWAPPWRPDLLQRARHLYVPGPAIGPFAHLRLRTGVSAWSITGVTHTLASHAALDAMASLVDEPLMPWDALVCTSSAAVTLVRGVMESRLDYLRWRFGQPVRPGLPQLPVIPLGVHCDDFASPPGAREAARRALGLADDEVVALFMGRLAFHAKAHPHAMYAGMQAAARASGKRLVLIQCGLFPNEGTERAYRAGTSHCPDVRCLFIHGQDEAARRHCWAGADFFISLSDNIQETFGLTPVEAMAAGLPVVVTDWDGYKDTVRDGVDGFRVPTWQAPAGSGEGLARAYEEGRDSYDMHCGYACMHVAPDHERLAQAIAALATDRELRLRMGNAAREHARSSFDWPVVYSAYRAMWARLDDLRAAAPAAATPGRHPARPDPFAAFAHYPSHAIVAATGISLVASGPEAFEQLKKELLFHPLAQAFPPSETVARAFALLGAGPIDVQTLSAKLNEPWLVTARWLAPLAKMGLVRLHAARPPSSGTGL